MKNRNKQKVKEVKIKEDALLKPRTSDEVQSGILDNIVEIRKLLIISSIKGSRSKFEDISFTSTFTSTALALSIISILLSLSFNRKKPLDMIDIGLFVMLMVLAVTAAFAGKQRVKRQKEKHQAHVDLLEKSVMEWYGIAKPDIHHKNVFTARKGCPNQSV